MNLPLKLIRNKRNVQKIFLLLSIISFLFLPSCQWVKNTANQSGNAQEENGQQYPDQPAASFPLPSPDINLAKPLQLSTLPEDTALCGKINETIEQSEHSNARWGVFVLSLKDGRIVCARDARQLFNPASIQKTITSIIALDLLGADYRFKTSIFAANQIEPDGSLNGDLTIYGMGAPDFDAEALENLVSQLQAKGLKRVRGNIVGDDSYFKGINIGDGWTWNDLQWHYGAEASALSFKENQAAVYMDTDGKPKT